LAGFARICCIGDAHDLPMPAYGDGSGTVFCNRIQNFRDFFSASGLQADKSIATM
jgi:hypothetical protein